jgi:glycosyltransferase involved in cell wall biosynthesis
MAELRLVHRLDRDHGLLDGGFPGKPGGREARMNLLVLTGVNPFPPHDGDKLRLCHLLRQLKRRGHRIDLFILTREDPALLRDDSWKGLVRRVHLEPLSDRELALNLTGGVLTGASLNVSAFHSIRFQQALTAYATSPEGLSVEGVLAYRLRMAPFAEHFSRERRKAHPRAMSAPWVLDYTDCLTGYARQAAGSSGIPWLRRASAWWDAPLLSEEEPRWARRADASLVVSESERIELIRLGAPESKVSVVPNGVEGPARSRFPRPALYPEGAPVAAFIGNLGYAPNEDGARWFIRKVWPTVRARVPDAVFAAVGGSPREGLLALDNGRDVRIQGYVPDLAPYLAHASLTVAPLRVASGFQNKVALSLARAVPVVATPAAIRFLPDSARGGVGTAEDTASFAHETVSRLTRPGAYRSSARRAGAVVRRLLSWHKAGSELDRVLRQVVKGRRIADGFDN